jgi:hypothetical protein
MRKIITTLTLLIAFNINAQEVPTSGKKIITVKESHIGEYLQTLIKTLPQATVENFKTIVTKKLKKYGFTDITITGVGEVSVPEGWATKLGKLAGNNRSIGEAQLRIAKTTAEITAAVNKMYQTDDNDGVDKKFQVNFINNKTGKPFKLRVSGFRTPKYIIKESDLIDNINAEK